jgi:hypothetical protein
MSQVFVIFGMNEPRQTAIRLWRLAPKPARPVTHTMHRRALCSQLVTGCYKSPPTPDPGIEFGQMHSRQINTQSYISRATLHAPTRPSVRRARHREIPGSVYQYPSSHVTLWFRRRRLDDRPRVTGTTKPRSLYPTRHPRAAGRGRGCEPEWRKPNVLAHVLVSSERDPVCMYLGCVDAQALDTNTYR